MKRVFCTALILAATLGVRADSPAVTPPAVSNNSAILAAQAEAARAMEERMKIMSQDIETLSQQNQQLSKRVNELEALIDKLREEQTRTITSLNLNGMRQDIKTLGEKIVEVDRKRESDKQTVLDAVNRESSKNSAAFNSAVDKLSKQITSIPAPAPRPTTSSSRREAEPDTSALNGVKQKLDYTVRAGESLGTIVRDANIEFKKQGLKTLTRKMVIEANPKVNFNNLQKDQKIVIPVPPKA